jgi:uncharacterized MAPEG superfamily protein
MTVAEWCLLGAVLLTLFSIVPAKASGKASFDNANPRDPTFYADGFRRRALGAHQNGFETFPFFAAAVILAEFHAAPQIWVDALAGLFLVVRLAYVAVYLGDRPTLRTTVWTVGFIVNIALFTLPAWGR